MQDSSPAWLGLDDVYPNEPEYPPHQRPRNQITFDEAIEKLESTKTNLAMESRDALELYALQQQVLIGDYYQFDSNEIERFASLLEQEQNKTWRKKRGMKKDIASRKFVRLSQEILEFEEIQASVNELLAPDLRDNEQTELQALFQQATVGDNKQWNPRYFPTVNREVWHSWSAKSGMTQQEARDEYSQKAKDLSDKYGQPIKALLNVKPSSHRNEFVHRHYHYYLPQTNQTNQYESIPQKNEY